ncbi:MAG TPA: DUF294 nucleotidyltransferase-like domain-containing protein [Oceanipulchritudo sp.]|nr:DUF294 nucleotidyltransferase-like domain-containing protein [Oceanipulchritudo sp.]
MKGSAISVRIADFLKDYPPFQFLEIEALRGMASKGKVKFHEGGEIVFSQGQPRDQWLYVIQQGNVRVIEETEKGESLIDLRGPGDLLGLQGIRSDEPYLHTGRTETETILYALPRRLFVELAEKSTPARRYLAAYFSLNPAYHWNGFLFEEDPTGGESGPVTLRRGGLYQVDQPQQNAREILVTVKGNTHIREVARQLQSKRVDTIIVVDEAGRPVGKITDARIRDCIVAGAIHPDTPVREMMSKDLVPAGPRENTGELLAKLTRFEKSSLVVTEDGSLDSRVVGLISERNLFLQYGRFPTVVGEAISCAPDVTSLRLLRDRLEALILEFLDGRRSLKWLMEMMGVMNRKFNKRIVELILDGMLRDGLGEPPCAYSWLMMGSGGRDELLIRSAVYHALVYADPYPEAAGAADVFFKEMARRVAHGIRQCGFLESPQNVLAHQPGWCLPLSEMKDKFTFFIRQPVASHVYSARDAFDFQTVLEQPSPLADSLSAHIDTELAANPEFVRHMASDSLFNQPPRTIFSGYVVDKQGIRRDDLAIKSHALLPLVDVGRVLALEAGSHRPTSTFKRLSEAAHRAGIGTPEGNLLQEAAEGFLVSQFARISQGLRSGTDGAVIRPAELDAETRTLLITTFRTIVGIFESTAKRFNLVWRD